MFIVSEHNKYYRGTHNSERPEVAPADLSIKSPSHKEAFMKQVSILIYNNFCQACESDKQSLFMGFFIPR